MEADAKAMVELLSPGGRLFSAMFSADMDSLVKFIFPLERLPTHTQLLLSSESGRCAPSPAARTGARLLRDS